MHNFTGRIIHTTAFVTPVVEHWLEACIECEVTGPDGAVVMSSANGLVGTGVRFNPERVCVSLPLLVLRAS